MERTMPPAPALRRFPAGVFMTLRLVSWLSIALMALAAVYAISLAYVNWTFITV